MDRCSPGFLLAISLAMLLALAGCAGKSSNVAGNSTVQSVTLSPAAGNFSIDVGSTGLAFAGIARNGIGQVVPVGITFVSSNNAALTIANDGEACAGTWDSLSNPVVCKPGVVGVAQVTATVGGVSSAPATVYVHQHIDNLVVSPVGSPPTDCFSLNDPNPQFRTWNYQATAYSNGVDITSTVGPIGFTTTLANVLTLNNNNQLPTNQVQVTAKEPGITNLIASVSGSISSPYQYTTCLVSSVVLQLQNSQSNTITFNGAGSATLQARVFDTHGNVVSNPPLTWGSTHPEVAKFTNATTTNGTNSVSAGGNNLGAADVFAVCAPPSCNIGVLPGLSVYSTGGLLLNGNFDPNPNDPAGKPAFGAIVVNVINSKVPTYTVWATTTGCNNTLNCGSAMFSVTTSNTNPIGATVTLPYTPNSLRITPDGTTAYLGSEQGLIIVSGLGSSPAVGTASQQTTPCNVAICGQVLTIAPDSKRVVVSDTQSSPNQVYIYGSGSAVNLLIPGATGATFSPDGAKLFIVTNQGKLFVYSTVDALTSVDLQASATDVAFSADGSFAYVAGTPSGQVSAYATCNKAALGASPTLAGNPIRVFPMAETSEVVGADSKHSHITQNLLAVAPPDVQILMATFTQDPLPDKQLTCNPPSFFPNVQSGFTASQPYNLGQGTFTPLYMGLAGYGEQLGAQLIVVAKNVPAVLVFDVNGKTTTAFPLVNNASPLGASASPDGSQIFVGACDAFKNNDPTQPCIAASVHIVNTQTGGDIQQTPFNNPNTQNSMCSNVTTFCVPDVLAVAAKQ